uniref:DUF223 domain-containing protein n=1 Tax=Steinernema glaseri TaxID=37863 RepID=A0A1I7Y9Z5_9BILA
MDALPWLFMERVCLCLERESLRDGSSIVSIWRAVFSATRKKIHTLVVYVKDEKLYAAARPTFLNAYRELAPLDSVDLKFVTNFTINREHVPSSYKEITFNGLQKLFRSIIPTSEGSPPVRYDYESRNHLRLFYTSTDFTVKLLSMRLPVDQ